MDSSLIYNPGNKPTTQPVNPLMQYQQVMQLKQAQNALAAFPLQQQQAQNAATSGGIANDTAALALKQKQNAAVNAYLAPAVAKGANATFEDYRDALARAHNAGFDISGALSDLASNGIDSASLYTWGKTRLGSSLSPAEQVQTFVGTPAEQNTGGTLTSGTRTGVLSPGQGAYQTQASTRLAPSPQMLSTGGSTVPTSGGVPTGAAPIPNTPSVGDMNGLQQVWDPGAKQFKYVPRQQVAPMVDGAGNPIGGSSSAPAAVPGLPPSGRLQASATAPTAPTTSGASAPLGTGEEATLAVQHAGEARAKANGYQQNIQPIEAALTNLGGADTGKGGETLNTVRGYVQDLAPGMIQRLLPDSLTDPNKRMAYDEAQKYTTAMAMGTPGATGSDARLGAAQGSNANVHISNEAAQQVVRAVLAQKRMEQAGTLAFNSAKGADGQALPASEYDRFMNQWNTKQDPRAYIADKMAPAERSELVTGMGGTKSAAYQKFKQSYQQGVDTGVVPGHGG